MVSNLIEEIALKEFVLGKDSLHGLSHWKRVEKIGLFLSEMTMADKKVIRLFAYFHDCKRENEFDDPNHGKRAAELVEKLAYNKVLKLNKNQLGDLVYACHYHNFENKTAKNVNIMVCWDSDRLDLWRVGKTPNPNFLFSKEAKSRRSKDFSYKLFINST